MNKIYIGIDPDLKKSGVAIWDFDRKHLEVRLLTIYGLLENLNWYKEVCEGKFHLQIIIEAGWLNKKSNFRTTQNKAIGEAIARKVGENHAIGKIIEQACQELKIDYKLIQPRTSKVTPAYFEKLTGIKTKNQEMIDAGMLVYGM